MYPGLRASQREDTLGLPGRAVKFPAWSNVTYNTTLVVVQGGKYAILFCKLQ